MIASFKKPFALASALLLIVLTIAPAAAVIEAEEAFYNTWARTDLPVTNGQVDRTWMWGPQANTEVISEPYAEHPTGQRPVQYYDKARMEVNNPNAEYDGLWYVTNGLLVVELMTGMMQFGHNEFEEHDPANINIAGDPGHAETPTYATYGALMDTPAFADGATITATVDADGNVGSDDDLADWDVTAGVLAPDTGHRTASVFWEFMTSEGLIWDWESGETMNGLLFENPYYATGLPITEAYWAFIHVDGTQQWVLTQAFERRVLTFTPLSEPGWQVEAGNVGLHYHEWRYDMTPPPPPPVSADFYVELGELNDSGVSGYAALHLEGDQLTVMVELSGLEVNDHAMHLHGLESGEQSTCPTPDMAGDDGLISIEDGLPAYGPVVLPLGSHTADADGNISFSETFTWEHGADALPLHTMVVHGLTVEGDEGLAYDGSVPVACGVVTEGERPVPPPPPEVEEFHFMLGALNDSGVSGSGTLTLEDGMLTVMFEASGLEANQTHAHHIHGFEDFQQSLCPTPAMAGDDGLLEFAEGAPAYGGVVLSLDPASEVGEDGTATYNQTFDLAELELEFDVETLVAHTIVLHGMTVGEGDEAEYVGGLPVACGAILPEEGFISELSGEAEIPPVPDSEGSGFATFHVPADDSALAFTLVVNGLDDVTAAHIHLKNEGEETGSPVLLLFAAEDGDVGVASNGVLNSAVVGDLDLVGELEGEPMSALIEAILAGETYVNVHTTAYPPGEIRGEMELVSDHFDLAGHEH